MFQLSAIIAVLTSAACAEPGAAPASKSARQILESYVADFRNDPAAEKAITFGVRVSGEGGGDYRVIVSGERQEGDGAFDVTLHEGFPSEPCVYYTADLATLRRVDAGELNALTAMAKAFSTDAAPMDIEATDGFAPPSQDFFSKEFIPLTFHFWTRGTPEIVPFSADRTRASHGAHAAILYYQKGLRSAWAQVRKGDHVNADPRMQTNPFPSMVIVVKNRCEAKLGGKAVVLEEGQMVFIPANTKHEFWNKFDEPAEVILLMFGDGA